MVVLVACEMAPMVTIEFRGNREKTTKVLKESCQIQNQSFVTGAEIVIGNKPL